MRTPKAYFKYWFGHRFITAVEVIGYTLSAIVGIGFIYTLIAREEVLAHAGGTIQPPATTVHVARESVIFQCLVRNGDDVDTGAPLVRVVSEPVSRQRLRASRELAIARTALNAAGDTAAVEHIERATASLGPITEDAAILAPAKGTVLMLVDPGNSDVLHPKNPIASIYDLAQLECSGSLEASNADKVEVGQPVRATLEGVNEPLHGTVVAASGPKEPVTIRFKNITPQVRQIFNDILFQKAASLPSVRVEIVVGSRSLFAQIFGRSN